MKQESVDSEPPSKENDPKPEDSSKEEESKEPAKREQSSSSADAKPFEISMAELETLEWTKGCEDLLADETYKKHLTRQANRVFLKLKTLHYIQHELIGAENAARLEREETPRWQEVCKVVCLLHFPPNERYKILIVKQ